VEERQVLVSKRDGSTEPFDRDKLIRSLQLACAKRPISADAIRQMAEEVEDELSRLGHDEIESRIIGEIAMDRLRARDYVAFVRFASVYRNFQDLDEFYEELRELRARRARAAQNEGQVELPLSDAT
jgi:transcriptional repressor NrdR